MQMPLTSLLFALPCFVLVACRSPGARCGADRGFADSECKRDRDAEKLELATFGTLMLVGGVITALNDKEAESPPAPAPNPNAAAEDVTSSRDPRRFSERTQNRIANYDEAAGR